MLNLSAGPGHGGETLERLQSHFEQVGVRVCISQARDGAQLADLAREAIRKAPGLLLAGGGDGTLSAVADVTRQTETARGILPPGTYNHFARDLGIPLDLARAVRTAVCGQRTRVDVGELNGTCFLNNASLGIYPVIVRRRDFQQRQLGRRKFSAVVVMHHPFDAPRDAGQEDQIDRYCIAGLSALVVQAGTATSTRQRGESNSFNVLRVQSGHIEVDRYAWSDGDFGAVSTQAFDHAPGGWKERAIRHG